MSYVKIWIHAVWTVKNQKPILSSKIRQDLFDHIHQNALSKEILMEIVGEHHNHVHCLLHIVTQEEHHKKKSWEDKYNEFIEKYGFIVFKDKD